jgi:hypothetical protein
VTQDVENTIGPRLVIFEYSLIWQPETLLRCWCNSWRICGRPSGRGFRRTVPVDPVTEVRSKGVQEFEIFFIFKVFFVAPSITFSSEFGFETLRIIFRNEHTADC